MLLLPEVLLEAENSLATNLKASSIEIIGTSPLAENGSRLNKTVVDFLSICNVFLSLDSR